VAIVKNFSMDGNADKDILRWLDEQSNQSAAIREAIRYYIAREDGVTLGDLLAEIRALPSRLQIVAVQGEIPADGGQEPKESAANLDTLLDRLDDGVID
jgi:hypothetical protein